VPTATGSLIKGGNFARDCLFNPVLDGQRSQRIRFVVWCSTEAGGVRFRLRRVDHGEITGISRIAEATGSGRAGAFRCRKVKQIVECAGHKHGPVVIRGWIEVRNGERCEPLYSPSANFIFRGKADGCSRRHYEPHFSLGYMRSFRHEFGLDLDLGNNRAAIDRRIRAIIRSWRRGEPVARVSAAEIGQPLRPVDQRELEFRDELLDRTVGALESWVPSHAATTYAGYWIDDQVHGGAVVYVGFTQEQEAQLDAFKKQVQLFAPDHVKPFPIAPEYSEAELEAWSEKVFIPARSSISNLASSAGVNVEENKVEVGTQHVAKMKRLLRARFGTLDPFLVVFERPGILL
jgi:hypothetical protein